jgi:hypothetical protein
VPVRLIRICIYDCLLIATDWEPRRRYDNIFDGCSASRAYTVWRDKVDETERMDVLCQFVLSFPNRRNAASNNDVAKIFYSFVKQIQEYVSR